MTFDNLKKAVGKIIKYYSVSGGWLTNRDVTEDDIGEMINQTYRDELFPMFTTQYPFYFRQVGYADSWIATGTSSVASTGTTLVATTSIFTNGMVGLYVWNDTDKELAIIDEYTSGTTVELDTTIGDTWDGDVLYVLGQEFVLGGDAADIYTVEAVGLKYKSTDQYYVITGNPRPKFDLFQSGGETFSQSDPQLYLTTSTTSTSDFVDTLGVLPAFDKKVEKAIELTYIAKPTTLAATGDIPRLPVDQPLIWGAVSKAFLQKQQFKEAALFEQKYEKAKRESISRFRPTSTGFPRETRMPRRFNLMSRRII